MHKVNELLAGYTERRSLYKTALYCGIYYYNYYYKSTDLSDTRCKIHVAGALYK